MPLWPDDCGLDAAQPVACPVCSWHGALTGCVPRPSGPAGCPRCGRPLEVLSVDEAGRLTERVTLQWPLAAGTTPSTDGEEDEHWSAGQTVWAEVILASGAEPLVASQQAGAVTHRVTIRRREDVTRLCRLLWRGRTLQVQYAPPVPPTSPLLELLCLEAA